MQSISIDSNGVRLSGRVHREQGDSRPTVVMVHGYPDSSVVYDRLAAELADRYVVCTYDVRGAGASDAPGPTSAYRLELLASDVAAVIDRVSPDRPVHLVGHDWGSIQSWEVVSDPRFAGRVASFTSISGPSLDHAARFIRSSLLSPRRWPSLIGQLIRSWYVYLIHLPWLVPLAWTLGLAREWPRLMRVLDGADVESVATRRDDGVRGVKLYRANFLRRLLFPRPIAVDVPVQVVVPTRDRFVSPALVVGLEAYVPRLFVRTLAAGHWAPVSHPVALAAMIDEFIMHAEGSAPSAALERSRVRPARGRAVPGEYAGQLVVVTGAGSGIGRHTLLEFAERGAEVVAVDVDEAAVARTAELARLVGATAHARTVDVSDGAAMEAFAISVVTELGAPDVVVNNAGIGMAGAFLDTSAEDWRKILGVNLFGVIDGSRLFARAMVDAGKPGRIVNVASAAAFMPSRALAAYATSKAAVLMLTECMRAELVDHGIDVSAVCPGFVETGIVQSTRYVGTDAAEEARRRARAGRLYALRGLRPEHVSKAILETCSSPRAEVRIGIEAHTTRLLGRLAPHVARGIARIDIAR